MPAAAQGRPHFQASMRELEDSALGALDMACGQLARVLDALQRTDLVLAEFVVADDDRIDGRYLEVHQGVLSLLALQSPVAGDLRAVAAVLHLINDVERIGDQCVNIAKLIPLPQHTPAEPGPIAERLAQMGAAVTAQLLVARRAFAERDVALARSLTLADRSVDRLNIEVFRLAVEAGEDADLREWALTTTLVARALDRIGANAVDIADQAIFVATGVFGNGAGAAAGAPA